MSLSLVEEISDYTDMWFWHHHEVEATMDEYPTLKAWINRDPERFNSVVLLKIRRMLITQERQDRAKAIIRLILVVLSSTSFGAFLVMVV